VSSIRSDSCSKIVLEGDPGLGGVPDGEVPELRDENVKVFCGADFSGIDVVDALEESFDSTGIRLLLFPDLVRFSILPTLESSFGRSDDPAVEGDGGVPPLILSLVLRSNGIGFSRGISSGIDRGIVEVIEAMVGVLTGRIRSGDFDPEGDPSDDGGGVGLVVERIGAGFELLVGDMVTEDSGEAPRALSVRFFGVLAAASKPMSSMLRGRGCEEVGDEGETG